MLGAFCLAVLGMLYVLVCLSLFQPLLPTEIWAVPAYDMESRWVRF